VLSAAVWCQPSWSAQTESNCNVDCFHGQKALATMQTKFLVALHCGTFYCFSTLFHPSKTGSPHCRLHALTMWELVFWEEGSPLHMQI